MDEFLKQVGAWLLAILIAILVVWFTLGPSPLGFLVLIPVALLIKSLLGRVKSN
jgi:hypothetical protein